MRRLTVVMTLVALVWCASAKLADFVVAGLELGIPPDQIASQLGQPGEQHRVTGRLSAWKYRRPGVKLTLSLWNGALTTIQAQGKWKLELEGKTLPAFGATPEEIRAALGPPIKPGDALLGKDWWIYHRHNQELRFHFEEGHVSEFALTMIQLPE